MPTIDVNKLPIAGQMAANADDDKKRKFLEGFNKSLGGPSDNPDEQKSLNGGMLSAMKRKMFGG